MPTHNLQAKLEISDRKTKLAANFLRVELGKKAVESCSC